jgi:hypothetical protein
VVREDPHRRGFLVLGTDTGLYDSKDSGAHWQPLKANLPTVPVYDVKFVRRDLVVATHGRGLWVLDDIQPLEALNATVESSDFKLVSTAPGTLFHHWRSAFGGSAADYSAPNAPDGVVLDYFLKKEIPQGRGAAGRGGPAGPGGPGEAGAQVGATGAPVTPGEQATGAEQAGPEGQAPGGRREGPVKIVITDSQGNPVATEYGPSKAGINRFVWSMRYDPVERLSFERPPEISEFAEFAGRGRGPLVLAGTYHVAITVAGHTEQADVTVRPDHNVQIDPSEFRAQLKFALEGRNAVTALNTMLNRVDGMQKTLAAFQTMVRSSDDNDLKKKYQPLTGKARELGEKLKALKDSVYNSQLQSGASEDSIHYLAAFNAKLSGLAGRGAFNYGQAPNQLALDEMAELTKELDKHLADFNQLIQTEVAAYNKEAFAAGAPTLYASDPISVKKPAGI